MFRFLACLLVVVPIVLAPSAAQEKSPPLLKVGMIGLDTSHVLAFTNILNNPKNEGDLANIRVVAAFPGGSPDLPTSRDRVEGYTKTLRDKYGLEIVSSIEELLPKVDVVLLESVDGRPHLQQAIPVIKAGKKVFIDKPMAGSLADVLRIFMLAQKYNVPVFSSSSLRFGSNINNLRKNPKLGDIKGCMIHGPCSIQEQMPDMFWYGIHGIEMLYAIMGPGCETVARVHTKDTDLVTGTWKGGRMGSFRGIRNASSGYGATVYGTKGIVAPDKYEGYQPMMKEVCKFFRTGQPPVAAAETIELFTFMEAADESKRRGGAPVSIQEVLDKAKAEVAKTPLP